MKKSPHEIVQRTCGRDTYIELSGNASETSTVYGGNASKYTLLQQTIYDGKPANDTRYESERKVA